MTFFRCLRPDLALPAAAVLPAVGFQITRPAALRFPIDVPRPTVQRVALFDARPAVRSFRFQPSTSPPAVPARPARPARPLPPATGPAEAAAVPATDGTAPAPETARKRTRITPPADVVKLSERFFYLLQPDLETILETSSLEFPRQPFPFQFDGMAFLMPRHGAVLADEMGLGKSMQAISSIRLLVRGGQARRVLVVCPKGLVSNWTRELADWAPEILVAVVEGDQQRRRWQ
ncbi:MAG: SNF2-related protein, partial [Planctomycetia bacterium]